MTHDRFIICIDCKLEIELPNGFENGTPNVHHGDNNIPMWEFTCSKCKTANFVDINGKTHKIPRN